MPRHTKSFKMILLSILLGIAVGTLVGGLLGLVMPEGIPRDVLTYSKSFTLAPFTVDLLIFSFTFGFSITFNLLSVLGIFVMIQLLKWSW